MFRVLWGRYVLIRRVFIYVRRMCLIVVVVIILTMREFVVLVGIKKENLFEIDFFICF